jgi:hypothetical protein
LRSPVAVDQRGWKALARELDALLPRIQKIEAESHKRLAGATEEREQHATVVLMLFNSPADAPPAPRPKGAAGRRGPSRNGNVA